MQETMQKREYGKISQFLQKKLPTLPQRILVAVAVTFLPIIILAIAICGISLFSTAAMMQQSYQRELNQMMVTLSDNLENARMKYENALKSYEDQMEQEDGYEEATSYDITYDLEQVDEGETFEMQYMFQQFNAMAEEVQKSHLKDTLMLQSELDNLRLQVNPHMLLNSFNTIYSLAQVKDFATIQEFSLSLVDYFRYVLRETSTMVSIAREMDFIKTFIEIQKIRHPDTFTCVYQVEAAAEEGMIPPLLIENFVENSMKHALIPGQVIEVLINIHKRDDKLQISIIDTGRGMSEEMVAELLGDHPYVDAMGKKHIGVYNCRRRLALFYGTSASFHIISALGEGTQIWIEVPYQAEEGEKNRETFDRG